jgi:hypothetical protein
VFCSAHICGKIRSGYLPRLGFKTEVETIESWGSVTGFLVPRGLTFLSLVPLSEKEAVIDESTSEIIDASDEVGKGISD